MNITVLTIFPGIFSGFLENSLIKKSQDRGQVTISLSNIRDFSNPPHHQVDDTPYGGGAGMVMKPEPLYKAVQAHKEKMPSAKVYLMSPRGSLYSQKKAAAISTEEEIILICGRYEGVDERFIELCVDEEISIGDFVMMGGEVAAMAIIESIIRLKEGVLGNADSIKSDSFSDLERPLLEAPHYTRPPEFEGKKVPEILLSGNHAAINEWRSKASIKLTTARRPELLKK